MIRQRDVRAWVAGFSAHGLAPATVVKVYQLSAKLMAAAVAADMLPVSPYRGISLPGVEQEEMRYLNPAEIACLAEVIRPLGRQPAGPQSPHRLRPQRPGRPRRLRAVL